jgi:cytochrome c oxidase subunit I
MSPTDHDARFARLWLGVAVGSLLIAGLFAVILVVGRMPPFSSWVTDPLFFKRCLVVHVDLALVVWFYAFLGSLWFLLPCRDAGRRRAQGGFALSVAGLLLVVAAVSLDGVQPVLANYVPVLDHPLFLYGLGAFGLGLALTFLDGRLLPGREAPGGLLSIPDAARPGLRAIGLAFVLAALTFMAGAITTPAGLPPETRYELAFWGGGHVLQFASEIGMVVCWLIMITSLTGRAPLKRATAAVLFGILVLPLLSAPVLASLGADSAVGRTGFTRLMQWGIFPAVSVFLVLCLRELRRARREGQLETLRDARLIGFGISAALTVLGFVLGAMIRGPNTMVPAHYHASIGAVTATFMTMTYVLLEPLGWKIPSPRLKRYAVWQPLLFGVGQMVFAAGFALAGTTGMARKTYGADQAIRSWQDWLGLVVMGVGGLVAAAGGILFLIIVVAAWSSRVKQTISNRRQAWRTSPTPSIPSRG